jgi:hypothetical protein
MTMADDAVEMLNKAYNDLIAACTNIADFRWADATDVDTLTWALAEIKYWSHRVKQVVEMQRGPICPTVM